MEYPPVIRPLEQGEIRLPHPSVMMTPKFGSALAWKYLIKIISFGYAERERPMSRRGVVDFATLQIGEFDGKLSYWNGKTIAHKSLNVPYLLIAGSADKKTCDEECSWFSSFLRWATRPPKYIQSKLQLRMELLTAAMMIYEAGKKKE